MSDVINDWETVEQFPPPDDATKQMLVDVKKVNDWVQEENAKGTSPTYINDKADEALAVVEETFQARKSQAIIKIDEQLEQVRKKYERDLGRTPENEYAHEARYRRKTELLNDDELAELAADYNAAQGEALYRDPLELEVIVSEMRRRGMNDQAMTMHRNMKKKEYEKPWQYGPDGLPLKQQRDFYTKQEWGVYQIANERWAPSFTGRIRDLVNRPAPQGPPSREQVLQEAKAMSEAGVGRAAKKKK